MADVEMEFKKRLAEYACEMALAGGDVIRKFHEGRGRCSLGTSSKSSPTDLVTVVDKKVDALLRRMLDKKFKKHGCVTEEGDTKGSEIGIVWYMDPVDGTTNFVHGYPFYSVSIGVKMGGRMVAGCVYDPTRDEVFSAVEHGGAYLNGRRISVSRTDRLGESMLATGFPYDVRTSADDNLDYWGSFIKKTRAVRRDGSAALDLCYVACGRFDGLWEMKLKPWDIAAGLLMVFESGGAVTDFEGSPLELEKGDVVASNGLIHEEILGVMRKVQKARRRGGR